MSNNSSLFFSNNIRFNICSVLIFLFPVALIAGPMIAELFLFFIISLSFTYTDYRSEIIRLIKDDFIIKMFALFTLYILILSILNYGNFDILKTGLFYFRYILFSLSVLYIVNKKPDLIKFFFIFYLSLIILLIIDSFIQHVSGQNIFGYTKYGSRIVSFFEGEGILGSYIVRFYVLASAFYFFSKVIVNKIILITIIFLIFILLIFSLERSALILFLIGNVLMFFTLYQSKKYFVSKALILIVLICLCFFFVSKNNNFFIERFYKQTKVEISKFFDDGVDFKRKNILIVSYNIGSKYYIIGSGPKSFRYKCKDLENQVEGTKIFDEKKRYELNCINHPHNYLFQLYAETGLIGLIFYLCFLFYLLKKILFTSSINTSLLCLKFTSISLLINIFPVIGNGNIFNNFLSMIFFYNLSFFLYFNQINTKK